jgi:hypothetical protein
MTVEDLTVGNTTIKSPFFIKILDYGVELPEIHSVSPVISFINIQLSAIVNWIERGLTVVFQNPDDEAKVYFYILEYNRLARETNEEVGHEVFKLAYKTEELTKSRLDTTLRGQDFEANERNPFKRRAHRQANIVLNSLEPNLSINKVTGVSLRRLGAPSFKEKGPDEIRMYDVFAGAAQNNTLEDEASHAFDGLVLKN